MHIQIQFRLIAVGTAALIAVSALSYLIMPSALSVTLDDDKNVNKRLAH
jgi:hypothetical protein